MKISKEELATLKSSELFELVSSKTDKYYRFFLPFRMRKERYDKSIILLIDKTRIDYNGSEDFEDFVIDCLLEYLKESIKEMYQDPKDYIIDSFGRKVKEVKEKNALVYLDLFHKLVTSFFSDEEIDNIMEELLKNDSLLNSSLYKIFVKNRKAIIDGAVPKVINNINLMIYIDYYCSVANINISIPNNNENEKDKRDVEGEELKEYLNMIRNIKLQSREEERDCILRIREGDTAAKEELICANLRFVANIARKYANYGVPLLELIQEGNIGLMKAIPNFDLEKGTRLSTYAHAKVRNAIIRSIDKLKRFIRMPVHACDMAKKLAKINGYLTQELNRIPTIEEISKESGIDIEDIEHIYRASFPIASISSPINKDSFEDASDEITIEDVIEDQSISRVEEQAIRRLTREDLINILESFKERDREIIYHLFGFYDGFTKTFDEVGDIYGVSKQNIGQIKDRIIKNIRKSSENLQMLRISDEIIIPVNEDYGALVENDDTFESLINKLTALLPEINPTHIIILFESMKTSNIEDDNIRALYVKYGYTEKQIEKIRESVSKEISKNAKAKYLYYRILEKREAFLLQGEVKETSVSQVQPEIKLLKRRMPYEDQYDLEIINYTLGLLNDSTMQEVIDEELFDYDQQIIKCLKNNQESEKPKSLEEFLSKLNLSIEQVKETALVCLDFYFERKYNIYSKDQEELKDNIYKRLILELLVCG